MDNTIDMEDDDGEKEEKGRKVIRKEKERNSFEKEIEKIMEKVKEWKVSIMERGKNKKKQIGERI